MRRLVLVLLLLTPSAAFADTISLQVTSGSIVRDETHRYFLNFLGDDFSLAFTFSAGCRATVRPGDPIKPCQLDIIASPFLIRDGLEQRLSVDALLTPVGNAMFVSGVTSATLTENITWNNLGLLTCTSPLCPGEAGQFDRFVFLFPQLSTYSLDLLAREDGAYNITGERYTFTPEPGSLALALLGLACFGVLGKHRNTVPTAMRPRTSTFSA